MAIPLVFEVLFVGVLAFLLNQAEQEASGVFRSANIGNCSNKLIKDIFELSAISHAEVIELFTSNGYQKRIETIRTDLTDLKRAAKGDPQQVAIVNHSIDAGEEAFILIKQLQRTFESGNALGAIDQLKQLRGELRSCMQRMISPDLIQLAQTEKQRAEEYHQKQLASRQHIQWLLIFGLILSAAITVFVALFMSKHIVGRLEVIINNNFRFASRMPLLPQMGGSDEIANIDNTFHEMAIAMSEAKQKEKSMIEHSLDVICSFDSDGKITAANPACRNILGYTEEIITGMNLRSIIVHEDIETFNSALLSAISGKTEARVESRIKRKDGGAIDVLWSIHWVDTEKSFFCVGHDITARKEIERLKQQFMAMISHDLRTPLTTIGNYLEMLEAGLFGQLNDKGSHLLRVAENNAHRMLTLINDLLDLEKAEFGGLKLECSSLKLDNLLDYSVKSVSSLAAEKQITIDYSPKDLTIFADAHRVTQVAVNLLSNAIKFSPQNSTIAIKVEQNNEMATISISDQGRGIPEHLKEAIFERFQQVEIADAIDKGGSGLGLAICKAIVELHNGKITIENNIHGGSTFSFNMPVAQANKISIM